MYRTKINVPAEVDFADLSLSRDSMSGDVSFDWEPIEKICRANGIDESIYKGGHESKVVDLLLSWYSMHKKAGGKLDLVAEALQAESEAEEAFGVINTMQTPDKLQ